jgi:hypothetical protein
MLNTRSLLFGCLGMIAASISADVPGGIYQCRYIGDWACGGDICIDTVRYAARLKNVHLTVDLDRNLAELNGISGHIKRGETQAPEEIKWDLPGLGATRFSFRATSSSIVADLIGAKNAADSHYMSEFLCNADVR